MADDDLFGDEDFGGDPYADAAAADRRQRPDAAERKGPGRPRGALNRKTKDFEKWFQARGFTDPLAAMAQFLTADPVQLQSWFLEHERAQTVTGKKVTTSIPSLWDIQKERMAVASVLGPYLHGKKPVEVAIIDERLPHLVIDLGTNQLAEGEAIAGRQALSLGSPVPDGEASEIKDLDEGEA